MRPSLERALFTDFPIVFAETNGSCRCGDGWEPLIRRVAAAADLIREQRGVANVVTQSKEKFGALRIYHRIAGTYDRDPRFSAIVHAAVNQSTRTCEVCGARGMLAIARGRAYRALCIEHLSRRSIAAYEADHAEPGMPVPDSDLSYDPAHDYRHLPSGTQPGEFVEGYCLPPIAPLTKNPSPASDEGENP